MTPKRQSLMASLLVAVTMAAPGTALAAGPAVPADKPLPAVESKQTLPLAQFKITRQEAVAIATKTFPIPADLGDPTVNQSQSKESAGWEITWRTPPKQANPRSITVTVDGVTGAITRYWMSNPASQEVPLSYNRSEALKLAKDWLAKLAPAKAESLRYVDNPLQYGFWGSDASFQFHWDRMEQGYPVANQGVDISIDARTGALQSYGYNWQDDLKVDLPKATLTEAEAQAAYQNLLPMQVVYRYYQKPATEKGEWKLVYRPVTGFPSLNQSGKFLDYRGQELDMSLQRDGKLVPAAAKPYVKPAQPLTPDDALAMAKALTGKTTMPSGMDCREEGEKTKRATCGINWYDEADGNSVNVQVDLTNGVVQSYGNWVRYEAPSAKEKAEPKYSRDQAEAAAMAFLQKFRPDLAGKVLLMPNNIIEEKMRYVGEPIRSYYFQFLMTRDYIPVLGHEASIEIDANTGVIRYFSAWFNEERNQEPFPDTNGQIKREAAIDSFLKHQGLELTWATFYPEKPEPNTKPVMQLVWAPRRTLGIEAIDAKTGVPYDYNGRDLIEAAKRPVDIDGHPAQREIELLWMRGIFELKDGKFNPDQTVSAAELSRWLVLARGMQPYPMYDFAMNFQGKGDAGGNLARSTESAYFGAALQAGILLPDDFAVDADPAAPVSRELYGLWVVRALGYGDIAKMEPKIEMAYADKAAIGAKYANAAALLAGLKIVKADAKGNFNPQQNVTRAEGAQMLYAVASQTRNYWR